MRLAKIDGEVVGLYVSRRNLEALLNKLNGYPPGSGCMLVAPSSEGDFFIIGEEDGEHYFHPDRAEEIRGKAGRVYGEDVLGPVEIQRD